MEKLYTVFKDGQPLVFNVSEHIAHNLWSAYPASVTYEPTKLVEKPLFRYDICFSTPTMNNASAHDLITRSVNPTLFPAYTVYDGHGSWRGQAESSYTFTVTQEQDDTAINDLAHILKKAFRQDSILVIKTPVTAWLI